MLGSVIIDQAAEQRQDLNKVAVTATQWLAWLNDAQRAVVLVRPDAKSTTENFQLLAGVNEHFLPAGRARLLGLIRNQGPTGVTVGRAIIGPSKQEEMDGADPEWHLTVGDYVVTYVYNEETPDVFYSYPTIPEVWYVRAKFVVNPTDLVSAGSTVDLDDIYAPALREWMLYASFARDSEQTPNYARAGRHFNAFFALLGVKLKADMAVSPRVIEQSKQLEVAGGR